MIQEKKLLYLRCGASLQGEYSFVLYMFIGYEKCDHLYEEVKPIIFRTQYQAKQMFNSLVGCYCEIIYISISYSDGDW